MVLIYYISCKTIMDAKPLRIRLDEVYGAIKIFYGTRYLALFGPWSNNAVSNRINSLTIGKTLTFHDFIILIKSVVSKNKNNCCLNIFLKKGLYNDRSNT